ELFPVAANAPLVPPPDEGRLSVSPTVSPARIKAVRAARNRLRRMRRLASAISGSSSKGRRGLCTVIAPLSLVPPPTVKPAAQGSLGNTGPGETTSPSAKRRD